ncbi:MAG: PEP/pyruvate-binding domain-containing protein [Desulforhabdus sp.]|jgi:pyruvate,water dikinase|nr:PEP/pyruvate-binding domain-containing protein [Desulforhabdus sp.]
MPVIEKLGHIFSRAFSPGTLIRKKYQAFKSLLELDDLSHRLMARLEQIHYEGKAVDSCVVRKTYEDLAHAISGMIEQLRTMAPSRYEKLSEVFHRIDADIRTALLREKIDRAEPHLLMLDQIPGDSELVVGGKAANLAAISRDLQLPIPAGFVITAGAFRHFMEFNQLEAKVEEVLAELDIDSTVSMGLACEDLQAMIEESRLPDDLEHAIVDFHGRLTKDRDRTVAVSKRSSAVAEDSTYSFAGQYRSVLNVNRENLAKAYKLVIAGKYSAKAISYRVRSGLADHETPMAVLVVEMVEAKASGILYTRKLFAASTSSMTLYSVRGLAEPLVRGTLAPDVIELSREPRPTIVRKQLGSAKSKAVAAPGGGIELVDLQPDEAAVLFPDDDLALQLAEWGLKLEAHFGVPQDIEWCLDEKENLFLLQTRPLRLEAEKASCEASPVEVSNPVLLEGGEKAASGVATGKVVRVSSGTDLHRITTKTVLVAPTTSPVLAQVIDKLAAIVTDVGSVAGHLASVAREQGVPTLVNTGRATGVLEEGEVVTVDADHQRVYAGMVEGLGRTACDSNGIKTDSPFRNRLRHILEHTSRLNLTNPGDPAFTVENCRTLNDILRFTHEKAIEEMFFLSEEGRGKVRGAKKLRSDIPISLYVLDLGKGIQWAAERSKYIDLTDITNPAMRALWEGLSHPAIDWSAYPKPFDWQEFDRISAGIVNVESQILASFALVARDYLNVNIRFGYHFVVIDAVCSKEINKNYIALRFEGGGADFKGRAMRIMFLAHILETLGLEVHPQGDLITARARRPSPSESRKKLKKIGRLLGYTRLLDIQIKDRGQLQEHIDSFLQTNAEG